MMGLALTPKVKTIHTGGLALDCQNTEVVTIPS